MSKNILLEVHCLGQEIGKLGWDEHDQKSYFQFKKEFLAENPMRQLIPATGIIRQTEQVQIFRKFNQDTFRGLPPMFADSLPDSFGNLVFNTWLETKKKEGHKITVLEQLAYVGRRGMGALEYHPARDIQGPATIDITEISRVLQQVLSIKKSSSMPDFSSESLLNIFKIGTSAGGVRPKILIAENKNTGAIVPGDSVISEEYNHYLVKLSLEENEPYSREHVEYTYYLTAVEAGIDMMESKLIDHKHFATKRFDRQHGKKQHALTATGLTGWDFKDPVPSSYENLFKLSLFLKIPHSEIEQLFLRMIFNVIFCNVDDHLKNHSFIYHPEEDQWHLAPAYDLTYAINPLLNHTRVSRALSVNGLRSGIKLKDVLKLADTFSIKNPKGIIEKVQLQKSRWIERAESVELPPRIIDSIAGDIEPLL